MPPKQDLFSFKDIFKHIQVSVANVDEPPFAKTLYKIVAVTYGYDSDSQTHVKSLFADATYQLHQPYRQIEIPESAGGVWGFISQKDAVIRETRLRIGKNHLPVAMAVIKGWNLNPRSIPRKDGAKIAYDYFCIVDLREVAPADLAWLQEAGLRQSDPAPLLVSSPVPAEPPQLAGGGIKGAVGRRMQRVLTLSQPEAHDLALGAELLQVQATRVAGMRLAASAAAPSFHRRNSEVTGYAPPTTASTMYMVVEVTPRGLVRSLYCEDAVYDMKTTYRQVGLSVKEGALHGFPTVGAAVEGEQGPLLQRKRLPLAVAELSTWNLGMRSQHMPLALNKRVGFDFVRVEQLLEVPATEGQFVPQVTLWRAQP